MFKKRKTSGIININKQSTLTLDFIIGIENVHLSLRYNFSLLRNDCWIRLNSLIFSNFLTFVYNSHLQNILVVYWHFVHQSFQVTPHWKIQWIQIGRSGRPHDGPSASYPSIRIFFVQILHGMGRNGSVIRRA